MRMTAIDDDFMTRFKQGVGSRDYDPATVDLVVNMFLGIMALAVLYALWTLVRRYFGGWERRVQNPEVARQLLEQAHDQRANLELVIKRPDGSTRKLDATLVEIADDLQVELSRLGEASERLIGREVECRFKLQDMRAASGARSFSFAASVTGVRNQDRRSSRLLLTMPAELVEAGQRRGAMRVSAAHENIKEAVLWPEASFSWPPPNPMSVSAPPLRLMEGRHSAGRLVNISGGGVRLEVRKNLLGNRLESLAKGSVHVLLLTLHDPEKKEDLRFILLARIQNSYEYPQSDRIEMGLQFIKRGAPTTHRDGGVAWRDLEDDTVLELEAWVIKRHLATHRPFRGEAA